MGHVARMSELSMPKRVEWISRVFARFAAYYGARFHDMWGGTDLDVVKQVWADDLADLSPDEITRGVVAAKSAKFPPTLPEFRELCRPALNPECAFAEAVQQMALRDQGRDQWSHPAIYWAASTVGSFDLRNAAWATIKVRWSRVLQAELAKGEWQPVPPRFEALPAPEQVAASPAKVREIIDRSRNAITKHGDTQWAHDVEARATAGEDVSMLLRKMAEGVLGRALPQKSRAHRPDYADRAAGDDSFEPEQREEEAVPL